MEPIKDARRKFGLAMLILGLIVPCGTCGVCTLAGGGIYGDRKVNDDFTNLWLGSWVLCGLTFVGWIGVELIHILEKRKND